MLIYASTMTSEQSEIGSKIIAALGGGKWGIPWPLPNMEDSTPTEFWGWRSTYSFNAEVYGGQHKIDNEWANITLFWLDFSYFINGGFAVAAFRTYKKEHQKYYKWTACKHEFKEKTVANCLHEHTCIHCKRSFQIDSSG